MEGMEEPSDRVAFSRIFADNFNKLVSTGVTPNEAAAAALLQTQESFYNRASVAKNEPMEQIVTTHIITLEEVDCLINDFHHSNNIEMVLKYLALNYFNESVLLASFTSENQSKCSCEDYSELESDGDERCEDMIVDEDPSKIAIPIESSPNKNQFINITKLEQINQILNNIIQKNINTLEVSYNEYLYEFISKVASAKTPYTDHQFITLFIIILEGPTISDPNFVAPLNELFECFTNKPTTCKELFQNWLTNIASEDRYKLYLTLLSQLCNINIYCNDIKEAKTVIRIISYFYEIKKSFPNTKISDFYIDSINQDYMTNRSIQEKEFRDWRLDIRNISRINSNSTHTHPLSLVSYPFILNPAIKAIILEMDAILQMRVEINNEVSQAIQLGSRYVRAYLILNIRREYIIPDTLSQMMGYEDSDFKKPLKVIFDGEEGVDAGGVRKEFYQIMMKQLLDPNFGMFKYFEESRLLWFDSNSLEASHEYELVGILLGIAIYNSIIVNLNMPMVIYKKLKNLPCSLADLAELEPTVARGLQQLLDYPGDVQTAFGATFQINYELYGEVHTVNLKSCQSTSTSTDVVEEVTNDNREEYVRLYVHWVLDHSVEAQFHAFAKGFRKVCGGAALDLFEAQELELLVCGNRILDFKELERGTKYDDGYTQSSLAIRYFWMAVHQFTEVEKKLFLSFVSGSDRAPIDGLADMGFVISKNGTDDSRLPSAHTCFNHLLLPEYSSFEILQKKLTYAIQQSEGFGLR